MAPLTLVVEVERVEAALDAALEALEAISAAEDAAPLTDGA